MYGKNLVDFCYQHLFENCPKINKIIIYNTTNASSSSNMYMQYWLSGVSATGDFYNLGGASYSRGISGIPSGWTEHTSL